MVSKKRSSDSPDSWTTLDDSDADYEIARAEYFRAPQDALGTTLVETCHAIVDNKSSAIALEFFEAFEEAAIRFNVDRNLPPETQQIKSVGTAFQPVKEQADAGAWSAPWNVDRDELRRLASAETSSSCSSRQPLSNIPDEEQDRAAQTAESAAIESPEPRKKGDDRQRITDRNRRELVKMLLLAQRKEHSKKSAAAIEVALDVLRDPEEPRPCPERWSDGWLGFVARSLEFLVLLFSGVSAVPIRLWCIGDGGQQKWKICAGVERRLRSHVHVLLLRCGAMALVAMVLMTSVWAHGWLCDAARTPMPQGLSTVEEVIALKAVEKQLQAGAMVESIKPERDVLYGLVRGADGSINHDKLADELCWLRIELRKRHRESEVQCRVMKLRHSIDEQTLFEEPWD